MSGGYQVSSPPKWAVEVRYWPLLTDGDDYMCPKCSGCGHLPDFSACPFCKREGTLTLDDKRVTDENPNGK